MSTNMLRREHGWFLTASQMLPKLGFRKGGHLPPEGFPPREVEGVMFRCLPATPGRRKHRIEFKCLCEAWVPYGRAGQHKCNAGSIPLDNDGNVIKEV
jgi:hypothetical protein